MARKYHHVKFGRLNVDKSQDIAMRYTVKSIHFYHVQKWSSCRTHGRCSWRARDPYDLQKIWINLEIILNLCLKNNKET
jgi:hypothetical protein